MTRMCGWVAAALLTTLPGAPTRADAAAAPSHVKAELVAEQASMQPGTPFWVALHLTMETGWHTYWINPGDSGMPTTIRWDLPEGFQASPIQWPTPQRIAIPPLMSFGYEGDVFLLTRINPGEEASGRARLVAHATWVECSDVCIKGRADATLTLPVDHAPPQPDPRWGERVAQARASLPADGSPWRFRAANQGSKIQLRALPPAGFAGALTDVDFFPEEPGIVDHAAPQWIKQTREGYLIELARSQFASKPPGQLRGVLVSRSGWQGASSPTALRIDVPVDATGGPS